MNSPDDATSHHEALVLPGAICGPRRLDAHMFRMLNHDMGMRASHAEVCALIGGGHVRMGGQICLKKATKVRPGDVVEVVGWRRGCPEADIHASELAEGDEGGPAHDSLTLIYDDRHIAVINKPGGLQVHRESSKRAESFERRATLVDALIAAFGLEHLSRGEDATRPGIVHRLDRETSGLMVICKNDVCHAAMKAAFAEHRVIKRYHALVHGTMVAGSTGVIDAPIHRTGRGGTKMGCGGFGKDAVTKYRVLGTVAGPEDISHLEIALEATGRTHQIRVHMASIHHPIVGDPTYRITRRRHRGRRSGGEDRGPGLMLAAVCLGFQHPITGESLHFEINAPEAFQRRLLSTD